MIKTGLGISRKIKTLISYINLFRFTIRKVFLGFEYANIFIKTVDKHSVQLILYKNGATIGKNCDIESGLTFHNCKDYSNLIIGNNCHIGKNCFFDLRDKIIIKDNVVISMQNTFITHIDMSKSEISNIYSPKSKSIIIHSNSYIGANSTILMGVEIEKSSFIAAGSLINKDVNSNTMVGGIPAVVIKKVGG